jgi:hypothetical protein
MNLLSGDIPPSRAAALFAGLAEKSLIAPTSNGRGNISRFRMLTTTRTYVKTYGRRTLQ